MHEEHWLIEKRQFPDHNNYKQYTEFDGYFNYTLYIYMETIITIELATSQDKMNTFLKKKKGIYTKTSSTEMSSISFPALIQLPIT